MQPSRHRSALTTGLRLQACTLQLWWATISGATSTAPSAPKDSTDQRGIRSSRSKACMSRGGAVSLLPSCVRRGCRRCRGLDITLSEGATSVGYSASEGNEASDGVQPLRSAPTASASTIATRAMSNTATRDTLASKRRRFCNEGLMRAKVSN